MDAKEKALVSHYDSRLDYYSPAKDIFEIIESVDGPQAGSFLDVGCGDGRAYTYAKKYNMEYLGVDCSQKRIEKARIAYCTGTEENTNPIFHFADIYEFLPMLNPGFDVIWCCELLEHLSDPTTIWEHMKQLCSGMIICTVPINMPYTAHLQVYKTEEDLHHHFSDIASIEISNHKTYNSNRDHFVFTYEKKEEK